MKIKIKQTLRSMWALVLAILMLLSTFSAVAVTLNVESTGATETTVYICPSQITDFSNYVDSSTGEIKSDYTLKLNTNHKGDGDDWHQYSMTKYEKTIGNKAVYVYTFTDTYSGLGCIQFQIYQGSTNKTQIQPFGTKQWTEPSVYNNKLWNASNWVAPSWDSSGDTSSYTFNKDQKIYYDFSAVSGGVNYYDGSTLQYKSSGGGTVQEVTLKNNLTFSSSGNIVIIKTSKGNWDEIKNTVVPTSGQNMLIVSSDGKSYTWGTYGSSPTETSTSTTSPSSAKWYLAGSFYGGNWSDTKREFIDGSKTVDLTAGTTYEFKLVKDSTWYGNNDPITDSVTDKVFTTGGGNCKITPSITGTYTFTINTTSTNPKLSVTYPQAVTTYDVTLDSNITGGSISSTSTLTGLSGEKTITLAATPSTGYKFTKWKTTSGSATFASDTSASTTATVTGACTITAEFTQLSAATSLEVTATPSSCKVGDTITLGKTGTVESGATLKYEYSTNGSDWSEASTSFVPSSAGTYQFRVTATKTGYKTVTSSNSCSVTVSEVPYVAESVTLTPTPATVEVGNAITLTASLTGANATSGVKYSFLQTTSLGGSFSPESVTGIDANEVTFTPTVAGTYKFKVTASCDGYKQKQSSEITVTVTAPVDVKADAFSEGMWIDAQPSVADSADAMVKPYFGTSGKVKFYLPGSVDLTQVHFYHKYNSLTVGSETITSGNTYDISSWSGKTITYGSTSRTLQIFKSTAKSLYINNTYTTASDGTKTYKDMPTSKVTDGTSASAFKKQCNFGGTYVALTKDGTTINSDKKLKSIKGRGNSSWQASCEIFGKYAYNISLGATADLAPGGTPSKKWSMLANNADEAMMRNILVYNLADAIGLDDSPMSDVYDVYNNGTYLGSYQMSEKVEVGSGLLVPGTNVDKLNEEANTTDGVVSDGYENYTRAYQNGSSINENTNKGFYKYCTGFTQPENYKSGNYLMEFELDERFPDEVSGFISNYGQQVVLKTPEVATKNEVEYAMDRFNFAEAVIYAIASGKTSGTTDLAAGSLTISDGTYTYTGKLGTYTKTGLDQLIDVENFAKAYLIQEFTENLDGVATSFYVDITGEKDVLVSKPVWDFDWTMGQYSKAKAIGGNQADRNPSLTNQWFIKDKYIYSKNNPNGTNKNIMATLCSIESFWNTVKTVWNGTSSASLLSTGSSSLFPVSALMGKKASLNPIGAATGNSVYTEIQSLYGASGKIQTTYSDALESSVAMNEDRYGFIATDSGISGWGSNETGSTWTAAVDYLDNWANKRATWMNARLNDVPEEKKYLYFKDEGNYITGNQTLKAYIYNYDGKSSVQAWPGLEATLIDEENKIYRVEYTGSYTNVIFNGGSDQIGSDNDTITQFGTNNMLVYRSSSDYEWTTYAPTVASYYIGGRFDTGTAHTGTNVGDWDINSTNIQFEYDSVKDLYYVTTNKTVADLSGKNYYFVVHKGLSSNNVAYVPATEDTDFELRTSSNKLSLSETTNGDSVAKMIFSDSTATSGNVTLWFDATNKQIWYTTDAVGAYTITKADATNGSFTVSQATANAGDTITITATPADGYVVDTVTVTGASGTVDVTGTGNNRTFTMPAENVTVSVTFKVGTASDYVVYLDNAAKWATPAAYAWNSESDKNGAWPGVSMIQVSGNIYKLTFTKEFANIIFSNNGANQTNTLTFGKVNNGKIYNNSTGIWSVYDTDKSITVSAGTCTGGSVKIDGADSVNNKKIGDQITLTANANDGYAFTGWGTITGLSITDPNSAQTSASITSVDADIEVTANFSSSKSGYYIKGTFNSWGTDNPLITTSGNVTTTTIKLNAGTYEFKVWQDSGGDGTWYSNNGTIVDTTTTTSIDGWTMATNTGNCKLEATGGTYTFTFDTNTKKLIITKGAAGNTATVISQDTDGNTLIGESLAYISSYTKVGESTPSANTTSSVNDIEDGTSVIFTAPTNQYYTFSHWLVNGVQTDPTETDGVSLKIENVTYDFDVYAVYDYITSDVAIAETTHGTVATDKTTPVRAGEVVTITLTPESGYSAKTVKVTDADGSNIPVTGSANRYTFVMPNKNVTVSATFAQADTFTVTYASNDITMGTVSADFTSGAKFVNGASLTVTATANEGYMFAGWYSDAQLTTKVYDNTPYTFTVSGDTSLYAKFVISKGTEVNDIFAVYKSGNNNPGTWTDYYKVYTVPDGSYKNSGYTHMFDINLANVEANKEFYFAISSTQNKTGMYWQNKSTDIVRVAKEDPDGFLDMATYQHYNLDGTNFYFGKIKVTPQNLLSLTGVTVYVKASGTDAGQYLVVPKGKTKPADTVTIYAKNGTLNTTSAYGTTTVTGINDELKDFASLGTPYSTYYGLAGDRIIAQTEVNATQAGYGWYVYAYVINGVEYLATKVDGTSSTYQMDTPYIVQEGQDVEITPIYLNTNIEKEDGYVTLYVDPNDLGDHWGNTISVYSYYYVGTSTKNAKEMNSAYPGEPMMLQSTGLYKAFIPKDAWEVNAKGVFAKVANCPVSGLTLNNYMEGETVHEKFLSPEQKNNYQTYDYDDFKIIAAAGYDTVKFDVKYRTNTTNQSSLLDNANDHPVKTGSTIDPSTYYYDVTVTKEDGSTEVTSVPEWEDLTDIDGNLASIVGFTSNSVPSGETFDASAANKLYIVSTGNQNTSMGEWSTVWYVYDHSGKYITQGLPSDFIPRYTVGADGKQTIKDLTDQTDAYQAIYTAGKQYTSALIAYESEQDASTSSNSGNSGTRLDGRWYYARSDAELSVTTHVLYADSESETNWTEDTYNSDLTGAYTGALATVEDVRDKTVSRNTSVTISASPSAKGTSELTYKFIGWATNVTKNQGGTYTPTKSTTLIDSTSIFSVVSDTDVYALYVPVGEGDLVINHSAYSTVNSSANGGTGRYFVQAVVKHKNGTSDKYYAQNGVTVPITSDDETVEVTLYTVSTNGCSYVGSYVYNGLTSDYNDITANGGTAYVGKVNPASAPATVTHSIDVSKIFGGDNAQKLTSKLDYYSDLKTNTITVKLNYYDRKLVNGSPADISDTPTTYTYKPATYPSSVYEKNAEGELVLSLSNLITYTVSNAVKPDNALDDYYYWTSQSDAVAKMQEQYNYHSKANYTAGQVTYHTNQYGKPQNTGDKWVTYYGKDAEGKDVEIDEGHATAENVSTISVWYFNTPKKYSYTMSLATDSSEIKKNTSGTYYYGTKEVKGTKELLYNQRLGGEDKTPTGNEASEYLQAYGVTKGYVDIKTDTAQNLEVTEKDGQNNTVTKALKFVGWATDTEGKNIVSTNYKYGLRITGNVKVYAIYGETELNHPGVNVQGIKPEQYFDEKNVSKTRISTTFTPYNCEDNDPNIANIGIVYLRVANSTTEKALENISDEDLKTLRYNIAKVVSKAEYSSFKSGTVDPEASATIVSLSGSTASGFKYKVVDQIDDNDTEKQAVLSNKNTGQITQIFSTSVIKGYTYYTFATMGYKNYPADSTDDSVYTDTTDAENVVTYITSDNFAKFEFNSNGVCVTDF